MDILGAILYFLAYFFISLLLIFLSFLALSFFSPTPISDMGTVRYRTIPYMTFALILANALVFLLWLAPDLYQATSLRELYPYVENIYTYGLRESFLRDGVSIGAFTTFTAMFMHGDLGHILINMIYLWTFGRRVEDACGSWRFLLFYLAAGMFANIGELVLNPVNDDIPAFGASGAIFGVMGAYLLLFPTARIQCIWVMGSIFRMPFALMRDQDAWSWTVSIPAWILLIQYGILEALPSFQTMLQGYGLDDGVAHLAHFAGFLSSLLVFLYVRKDLFARYIRGRSI